MTLVPVLDTRSVEPASLPHNLEAEQSVLGCALFDNSVLDEMALKPDQFYEPFHARVCARIQEIRAKGLRADVISVGQALREDPALAEVGAQYLADLWDRSPPTRTAVDHAALIADLALKRELVRVADETGRAARKDASSGQELVARTERALADLVHVGGLRESWIGAEDLIGSALDAAQAHDGRVQFPIGLADVDDALGGLNAGESTILAARPGMGKTVGAVQTAKANAALGLGVSLYSLEMGAGPLGLRLACDLAFDRHATMYSGESTNPTFDRARRNQLSSEQWAKLRETKRLVAGWHLNFDTRPALTLSQIESSALRAIRKWERQGVEPGPVIVDHLGLVRPETGRQGARHAEVADISRGLAAMAKRLGVPVVALCQLNRGVEAHDRKDKRPHLSDLRQAGELEEDARQVIFLFRPEYYFRAPLDGDAETFEERAERQAQLERHRYKLHWIIAKNSHGPMGQVETFCDIGCSAIRDRQGERR